MFLTSLPCTFIDTVFYSDNFNWLVESRQVLAIKYRIKSFNNIFLLRSRIKIGEKVLFHNIEANKMPLKSGPIYIPHRHSWLTRMVKESEVVILRGSDFWDYKLQSNEATAIVEKNDNK